MKQRHWEVFNTYSIVARDAETGQIGVAVQTHQMCVGVAVPWLEPGIGAIATQASTNISFGPMGLAMLAQGLPAQQVLDGLIASDPGADRRQLAVVDANGCAAAWTGANCTAEAGHYVGEGYSVQANLMTRTTVIDAMRLAYERAQGDLAGRMLAALQAAQAEDGDIRGMQSAALVIVPGSRDAVGYDRYIYNLRVDEHDQPLEELARLVRLVSARHIDRRGYEALERGDREAALALWAQAREQAPELEEIAFRQAVTLADTSADVKTAASILRPALAGHERREHWLDLLRRLQACGIIEREGCAEELIAALKND
jgi:uncharacterized Ntn-hydrolase superfamily protein